MIINEVTINYEKKIVGKISGIETAVEYLKNIPEFENRMEYQEVFAAVYLDVNMNVLCHQVISIGAINQTIVDIRIIMSTALKTLATNIILAHNHPSGNLEASTQDKEITKKIIAAADLFNIKILDHIILTRKSYFSFSDKGLL